MNQEEYNKVLLDFNKYKKEIFEGQWKVRFMEFSQYSTEELKYFDRRCTNTPIITYKTIAWMVDMQKRNEEFHICEGSHIKLIYEIIVNYLRTVNSIYQMTYSLNGAPKFPVDDIIALDSLSARFFIDISHVYGQDKAFEMQNKNTFSGYTGVTKLSMNHTAQSVIKDRTLQRPNYIDNIMRSIENSTGNIL